MHDVCMHACLLLFKLIQQCMALHVAELKSIIQSLLSMLYTLLLKVINASQLYKVAI